MVTYKDYKEFVQTRNYGEQEVWTEWADEKMLILHSVDQNERLNLTLEVMTDSGTDGWLRSIRDFFYYIESKTAIEILGEDYF